MVADLYHFVFSWWKRKNKKTKIVVISFFRLRRRKDEKTQINVISSYRSEDEILRIFVFSPSPRNNDKTTIIVISWQPNEKRYGTNQPQ